MSEYPRIECIVGSGGQAEPCVVQGPHRTGGWYGFARGYSGTLYWDGDGVAIKAGNIGCGPRYDLTQVSLGRLKQAGREPQP